MSSPIKRTKRASIDDLPPELICELFKHLHLRDLAACSLVNKHWHSIYSSFKLDGLIVNQILHYDRSKWCHSDRKIEDKHLCHPKWFNHLAKKPLLSNLKHLALSCKSSEFDLNELNRFGQLVHLEIVIKNLEDNVNLVLPKLKVLVFHYVQCQRCSLLVDCPELSLFDYRGEPAEGHLEMKHPETIKKLDADIVGSKLAQFQNVECLVARKFEVIDKATLQSLPRLKELHCNVSVESVAQSFDSRLRTLDRIKRTLRKFIDDLKVLRGSDFRFSFAGFQLTNPATLDAIDFGLKVYGDFEKMFAEYLYMKNYQLLDPDSTLDFINRIDYTRFTELTELTDRFMSNEPVEMTECLLQKFSAIKLVGTNGGAIEDANHFLAFLKSLRSLRSLQLENPELDQEFYDQLPASAPPLSYFRLDQDEEPELNFDFVGKFRNLSVIQIYQHLTLPPFKSLARHLRNLSEGCIHFRVNESRFYLIEKQRDSKVWKIIEFGEIFETENPEEIPNFLERFLRENPTGQSKQVPSFQFFR